MRFLSLFLGLLLLTGCKPDKPMPDNENAVTAFALQHFIDNDVITGAVTAVISPDGIIAIEAFGLADVAKKRSMSKDSMFWIASMTKPMTAMGVMMLVEEGKVKLDDPLEKFVPEFKGIQLKSAQGLVAPKRAVTVKDLLTHTSGIDTTTATAADTPVDTLPLAEMCVAYAKKPLVNEPGSQWTYNNNGINLLGRIIEVASGKPFADFMEERLFEPLGMIDTSFYPTDEQLTRLAGLYGSKDGQLVPIGYQLLGPTKNAKHPIPAGGLYSTAADLAKLYRALLHRGTVGSTKIISEPSLAEMTKVQTGELKTGFTDGMGFGFGFAVTRKPEGVHEMLSAGTFGHGGAFGTQGWIDPHQDLFVILLIQRVGLANADASDIRRDLQKVAVSALKK